MASPAVFAQSFDTTAAAYGDIMQSKSATTKAYAYRGENRTFVIDLPSLSEQGKMFNRIVALVEAAGAPRDRVLSNDELADYIRSTGRTDDTFAYGNDFRIYELVVFFNLASNASIELTSQERWLRDFLLQNKLMEKPLGYYRLAGRNSVIISLPQEQGPERPQGPQVNALARQTILQHELSHAEYFTNRGYANYCRNFWDKIMSDKARDGFRRFLGQNAYDARNRELLVNETQAYLMHTPDPAAFNARKVGLSDSELLDLRTKFLQGNPPTKLFQETSGH